ncbi:MAG TPA: hypothetical protein DEH78_09670 [Solibacterales bacterium]|nr:hypothetical protein [Bryobacterales bacterium]
MTLQNSQEPPPRTSIPTTSGSRANSDSSNAREADAALARELALLLKRSWWKRVEDYLFGYDFFISYRWEGGKVYAIRLAKALAERGFDSFLDSESYQKGDDWQAVGAAAILRTSTLIVVGSPGIVESKPVLREVKIFCTTGRKIIPIDFDGSLDAANLGDCELAKFLHPEILKIGEHSQCLESGPSAQALDELQRSFVSLRQSVKRMRALRLVIATLGVLLVTSIALGFVSERRRSEAVAAQKAEETARTNEHQSMLQAQKEQRLASAQAMASSALLNVGENSQLSLELALKSIDATAQDGLLIPEAMNALRRALKAPPIAGTLLDQQSAVMGLALSPDGESLLSTSANGVVKILSLAAGEDLFPVRPHGVGRGEVAFSSKGRYFVTAGPDGVRVWSARDHRQLWATPHRGPVVFTPDEELLLVVNQDSVVYLDSKTGAYRAGVTVGTLCSQSPSGPPSCTVVPVSKIAISPDGRLLAVCAESEQTLDVSLWDLSPHHTMVGQQMDSTRVYSEATKITTVLHEDGPRDDANVTVRRISFNPAGTRLVVASKDLLSFWSIEHNRIEEGAGTGRSVVPAVVPAEWKVAEIGRQIEDDRHGFWDVAYAPDGNVIASAGEDAEVRVWSIEKKTVLWRYTGHRARVNCVRFTKDGRGLITASDDGTVRRWKVADFGEAYTSIRHRNYLLTGIRFTHDDKYLASFGVPWTEIWSVETGELADLLPPGGNSFDPVEDHVVRENQVYDWKRRKPLFPVSSEGLFHVSEFSPDGRLILATRSGGGADAWSGVDGHHVARIRHPEEVLHLHWDHSGRRAGTAGLDRVIRIWSWDSHSFALQRTLEGHGANILDFAFDPAGKRLASCDVDGNAILWDLESGKPSRTFERHIDEVQALDFSPDGSELATAGLDSTIRLWDLKTGSEKYSVDVGYERITSLRYSHDGRWLAVATVAREDSDRRSPSATNSSIGLRHDNRVQSASGIWIYARRDADVIRLARKRAAIARR